MITIDWATRVIYIPKADMLLVQSTPTEIRELNLDTFRLRLKDLEDDAEGMSFPHTHEHNPPVTVGGVTLARVINMVNRYTVTFENGTYAVNLVGANSNVADVVNLNNVSVRSANSAGLVQMREIEQSSFEGYVHIDQNNGGAGTTYPSGTLSHPVNNIDDAKLIAMVRGLPGFFVTGELVIQSGEDVSGLYFKGKASTENLPRTKIILTSGCITAGLAIEMSTVTGKQNGEMIFSQCMIENLEDVEGTFYACRFLGTIKAKIGAGLRLDIVESSSNLAGCILDANGSPSQKFLSGFKGHITIKNMAHSDCRVVINLEGGHLLVDASCTQGMLDIQGYGEITDNSNGTLVANNTIPLQTLTAEQQTQIDSIESEVTVGTPMGDLASLPDSMTWREALRWLVMFARNLVTVHDTEQIVSDKNGLPVARAVLEKTEGEFKRGKFTNV